MNSEQCTVIDCVDALLNMVQRPDQLVVVPPANAQLLGCSDQLLLVFRVVKVKRPQVFTDEKFNRTLIGHNTVQHGAKENVSRDLFHFRPHLL